LSNKRLSSFIVSVGVILCATAVVGLVVSYGNGRALATTVANHESRLAEVERTNKLLVANLAALTVNLATLTANLESITKLVERFLQWPRPSGVVVPPSD